MALAFTGPNCIQAPLLWGTPRTGPCALYLDMQSAVGVEVGMLPPLSLASLG